MNNLIKILGDYFNGVIHTTDNLRNLTTDLQTATPVDIVFYRLQNTKDAENTFCKRLKNANPGLLVLNKKPQELNSPYVVIPYEKWPEIQKKLCDELYPLNRDRFKFIAITGTNGKTSVANMAGDIWQSCNENPLVIGTMGIRLSGEVECDDIGATTPSYINLRKILYKYTGKYNAVFIEASSHALDQERFGDLKFDIACWTNITPEHLDYHSDMNSYFEAKAKIFNNLKSGSCLIIPNDNLSLDSMLGRFKTEYSIILAKSISDRNFNLSNPNFKLSFNRSNLEIAIEIIETLGKSLGKKQLNSISPPLGRFTLIDHPKGYIAVDYAHTPDALSNILSEARKNFGGFSISLVFGCGGERDRSKRPLMGKIASEFADTIIVTNDNPRNEDPQIIASDILTGCNSFDVDVILDRKAAINTAIQRMTQKTLLVIAGKGHESYQEIKGIKYPFNDFNIIKELIGNEND